VREREVLDQEVLRCRRLGEHLRAALRKLGARVGPRDVVHRPARAGRQRLTNRERVIDGDLRATLPGFPFLLRDIVLNVRKTPEVEGVDAKKLAREIVFDVAVHSLHDRHDRDQEHDADRYADECEEALQLLHAQRTERETNRFE